jgi:hypothetical protein
MYECRQCADVLEPGQLALWKMHTQRSESCEALRGRSAQAVPAWRCCWLSNECQIVRKAQALQMRQRGQERWQVFGGGLVCEVSCQLRGLNAVCVWDDAAASAIDTNAAWQFLQHVSQGVAFAGEDDWMLSNDGITQWLGLFFQCSPGFCPLGVATCQAAAQLLCRWC